MNENGPGDRHAVVAKIKIGFQMVGLSSSLHETYLWHFVIPMALHRSILWSRVQRFKIYGYHIFLKADFGFQFPFGRVVVALF